MNVTERYTRKMHLFGKRYFLIYRRSVISLLLSDHFEDGWMIVESANNIVGLRLSALFRDVDNCITIPIYCHGVFAAFITGRKTITG